jgi:hypothetical protein
MNERAVWEATGGRRIKFQKQGNESEWRERRGNSSTHAPAYDGEEPDAVLRIFTQLRELRYSEGGMRLGGVG